MTILFDARISWLDEPGNAEMIRCGLRGLEKESLRVDAEGGLSTRPHPVALGSALTHPYLTTDYSEALPEIVTPPLPTAEETLRCLDNLHAFIHRRLDGELLWPASIPSRLGADREIPIAEYGSSNLGRMKNVYRRGLGFRYGRVMQAIAGIHFNYSPPVEFWSAYQAFQGRNEPATAFRSRELLALARNYRRRAWLVTYLFGASPALDKSFRPDGHEMLESLDSDTWYAPYATSLRMSDLGYRNSTQAKLCVCLNSLDEYISGLHAALTTVEPRYEAIGVVVDGDYRQLNANVLQIENENYSSIRPKPGKHSEARPIVALRHDGVEYVEVRTLDLNPVEPAGVSVEQLRFLEALLIACLLDVSPPIDAAEQREIDARDLLVARAGRTPKLRVPHRGTEVPLQQWGLELLDHVEQVAALIDDGGSAYQSAVQAQREVMTHSEVTPSGRMLDTLVSTRRSYFDHVLELAHRHAEHYASLAPDAAEDARLDAIAAESLLAQQRLEAHDRDIPFDTFLANYFAQT